MPKFIPTILSAAAVTLASAALLAQSDAGRSPQTVKDVMLTMTIPASDAVFTAAADPPKNDEGWAALRRSAQILADSGRLLRTPALAQDSEAWMERATELVKEAEATLRVAEAKNLEGLETVGDAVYGVCESCHERYLPQP